ncbi:MAG: aldehyde dehydrogenase family protein [Planctomycetales bacterium]|nr:aldehyde dehydrogenase family protein [Planctomycetales bacterium]
MSVLSMPALRWGQPYESLEVNEVRHFLSGDVVARISQVNGGMVRRDMRQAGKARDILRQIPIEELLRKAAVAADLFETAELPMGDGTQTPEQFVKQQSATTGLPEVLCRSNITKNAFVLRNMPQILEALTRGLDPKILEAGYGREDRGVIVSYQAQTTVLGAVLPSNSPGVHTLWLPVVPLQMGLVLKPGGQEPWTAYRVAAAFQQAGIPGEPISLYPGGHDVGESILAACNRSMIFGSAQTVAKYAGNPGVQVHGPGFSKILIGDDCVDRWEQYLDLMVESVYSNGGRSCINCSAIYTPRHGKEIAQALAERLGPIDVLPPEDPNAGLAAFTTEGTAKAIWEMLQKDLGQGGVTDMTAAYGDRLVEQEKVGYLRPMVVHCASSEAEIAAKEFMFPFVSVVECPQAEMLGKIGSTLVATALTEDKDWSRQLVTATNIDRLNIGPIPTNRLNWLQPHEGNLIDFLFRSRAVQMSDEMFAALG